jgi:hypothetical protein
MEVFSGGSTSKVAADEVSSRVIERYEGVILTLKGIPSRFGDEAT